MAPGVIIPELDYEDVNAAAAWLCRAFGFEERLRIASHRVQITFRGASVVAIERPPRPAAAGPARAGCSVMVRVEDVDRHHERAARSGAAVIRPPASYPYGERQYTAEDPGGHRWTFSQSIADVDPGTWGGVLIANSEAEE